MYSVKLDNNVLYDPRIEELALIGPKLNLEVNKAGTFEFTLYPSHPLYDNINKLKSTIEVYQDGALLFRGRPLNDSYDFNKARKVLCEGDLAFLNDSIQRPYEYNGTVEGYLQQLIEGHNEQVEAAKEFTLGTVTVEDPNDYIVRADSTYPSTWEVVQKKLLDLLGGYIVVRRSEGVNYIDYLADSAFMSTQTISLGENLLDVDESRKGQDIYTAILPIGAKQKDENGIEYRVDIKSVNGGVDYIYDTDAVAQYGMIVRMVEFKDTTLPSNLLTQAQAQLAAAVSTQVSIDLKAVDLSMMDVNIDEFRVFEYVKVESTAHGLNAFYLVKKLGLDLANPKNNSLTVGETFTTITERQYSADNTIKDIREDYVTNETVQEVRNEVRTAQSNITQTADQIRSEVRDTYTSQSDFALYKSDVSTQFLQTASTFNFNFKALSETIGVVDGDSKAGFTNIQKYIRFVDGNIILGALNTDGTESPFKLKLTSTKISFLQNNSEVAYMSNNKLYINDGQIVTQLQIGRYKFVPRTNGNLSFEWVGE